MKDQEIYQLIVAIIVLSIVISLKDLIKFDIINFLYALLFAFIVLGVNLIGKKVMASNLDAGVEHKIWHFYQTGFKEEEHLKKPIPLGIILPLAI